MRILAISGSLRTNSTNTNLVRSLTLIAPPEIEILIYEGLDQIPAFNPDLEGSHEFDGVTQFRKAVRECQAAVISTPEYAHGIPGALKNALDWVVGTGEFSEKPVALVNASSRAVYAQAAIKEVLTAMNARLVNEGEVTVDFPRDFTAGDIAAVGEIRGKLRQCLEILSQTS